MLQNYKSMENFNQNPSPSNAAGITVDMVNSLRIGDPEVTEMSVDLQQKCEQFVNNVGEVQHQLEDVQRLFRELGELADREKMLAMNAQNELKLVQSNQAPDKDYMRLHATIQEKTVELEHAKRQLENLKQIEAKQQDYIRRLQSIL